MLERLIGKVMLWGIGGVIAGLLGYQYTLLLSGEFDKVTRALAGL